jgi:hypothetical protein
MKIRNWFRLSLRDLFWATALAALAMGWCVDHVRMRNTLDGVGTLLEVMDGDAAADFPLANGFGTKFYHRGRHFHAQVQQVPRRHVQEKSGIREVLPPD